VRVVAERFGTALCLNDISSCEQTEFVVGPLCFGGGIVVDWAFPFILRSACGESAPEIPAGQFGPSSVHRVVGVTGRDVEAHMAL